MSGKGTTSQYSGVYNAQVLDIDVIEGQVMTYLQWDPTMEPAAMESYGDEKYKVKTVSEKVYKIGRRKMRKVTWYPTWEKTSETGTEGRRNAGRHGIRGRLESMIRHGLPAGWELLRSPLNIPFWYNPSTGERLRDAPSGTSPEAVCLVLDEQERMFKLAYA
jgi:hypothetical protein